MTTYIAERKLQYSIKGLEEKHEFTIRIGSPYIVEQKMVKFPIGEGLIGCHVEVFGLEEELKHDVYGVDGIQALDIASNVDALLERLKRKYDLFWPTGEDYFEI